MSSIHEMLQIGDDDALILSALAENKYCFDIGTNAGKSAMALSKTATLVDTCDTHKPDHFVPGFAEAVQAGKINYENSGWEDIPLRAWDMVFIDHFGNRLHCAARLAVVPSIRIIAIHDTRTLSYRKSEQEMPNWRRIKHETKLGITIFERSEG